MKVAIVHDDLVQWGGAERVLEGLCELYPDAPIYTSVFDNNNQIFEKKFRSRKIITSFLQKVPFRKWLYRAFLPFYPIAFEQFDFSEFDLVISHTTRFAKNIITKPTTKHISYIHTPPRFLWNLSGEKVPKILYPILSYLRIVDVLSSRRVDQFIAGSVNSKERIMKFYKKDSSVIYPFIDDRWFGDIKHFNGGYFIVISRLNSYKRIDLVIKACQKLKLPLKIIGTGNKKEYLQSLVNLSKDKIEFLDNIGDKMLVHILSGAQGLIIPGEEDFGLTSLEAQARGVPVIAFRSGGALETVIEKETGLFFEEQTVESLVEALKKFGQYSFNPLVCKKNAERFNKEYFKRQFQGTIDKLVFSKSTT